MCVFKCFVTINNLRMNGYQKLLLLILLIGFICVYIQSGSAEGGRPETEMRKLERGADHATELLVHIRNECPGQSTFSLTVNGRKLIACHNPTPKGETFVVPLRHYGPLKSVDIYKHTSRYGPIYIDKMEIGGTSLLSRLIFTGRNDEGEEYDINLFHDDAVRWSELCTAGLLVHQGRYNFRPDRDPCPFMHPGSTLVPE